MWYNLIQEMLTPLVRKEKSIKDSILFGKYRVISSLGRGNSSRVFIVEHTKLKAYRAVKCIAKTQIRQPQFLLEADILKNLKHPGIPTIYDVEEDDDAFYLIEEYIQGQSLEAYVLRQDCISADTVIKMVLQICDVLKYLHNQKPEPIIYQDLKPEHIILCGERIVLIDFGISSYITSSGNAFQNYGTEGYAPPEKYQGIFCDVRADIYGVGKILEFLAAKMPAEEFQLLKPLIWKATAYAREDRYPSIEALAAKLDGLLPYGYQTDHQANSRHLLTEIAVAGTQERVGTTHFAIALTCFLNQKKKPFIYQEHHKSDCMRLLIKEDGGCMRNGLAVYAGFQGMPYYGEGIAGWDSAEGLYIQDYGVELKDILERDKRLIVIMGSRPWERERTRRLLERICFRDNLALVCNYGSRRLAKNMAKTYHRRIYCFPLDADPFCMTREKRRFFKKLLLQERW